MKKIEDLGSVIGWEPVADKVDELIEVVNKTLERLKALEEKE